MSNKEAANYDIQLEYGAEGIEESIEYDREDTVVVAIGESQFDTIVPAASVAITHLWNGKQQSLVGFSSLNPLQSLRSLLKGTLFTDIPLKDRLTIAKAIASDLTISDHESNGYCSLIDEISELVLIQDGHS